MCARAANDNAISQSWARIQRRTHLRLVCTCLCRCEWMRRRRWHGNFLWTLSVCYLVYFVPFNHILSRRIHSATHIRLFSSNTIKNASILFCFTFRVLNAVFSVNIIHVEWKDKWNRKPIFQDTSMFMCRIKPVPNWAKLNNGFVFVWLKTTEIILNKQRWLGWT